MDDMTGPQSEAKSSLIVLWCSTYHKPCLLHVSGWDMEDGFCHFRLFLSQCLFIFLESFSFRLIDSSFPNLLIVIIWSIKCDNKHLEPKRKQRKTANVYIREAGTSELKKIKWTIDGSFFNWLIDGFILRILSQRGAHSLSYRALEPKSQVR